MAGVSVVYCLGGGIGAGPRVPPLHRIFWQTWLARHLGRKGLERPLTIDNASGWRG